MIVCRRIRGVRRDRAIPPIAILSEEMLVAVRQSARIPILPPNSDPAVPRDDADVPDRFQPADDTGKPGASRRRDRRADLRTPADSNSPLRKPVFDSTNANGRTGVELTSAERISPTLSEPFSPEWNRTLKRLVELSDAETSKDKTPSRKDELSYLRRQVYLRMLYLLSGKTTQAVQAIPHIEAPDQEFWQKTMWGISAYLDDRGESDRRSRATQTITRFNEAIEHLRSEADLTVRNVLFCRKIDSFGSYEKVTKTEFRPGEQVLLYAEIENFKTERTAQSPPSHAAEIGDRAVSESRE